MVVQLRMWHMSMMAAIRILPRSLTKPQPLLTGSDVMVLGSEAQETHCILTICSGKFAQLLKLQASVYSLMVIDDCANYRP